MRFQSVEVVSVFPLPSTPSKPDLVNLRRKNRQVGFQVAIQEVGHHNPIGHHVDHHVPDPGEKFHLFKVLLAFPKAAHLILCQPYGEVLDRSDQPDHFLFFILPNPACILITLR